MREQCDQCGFDSDLYVRGDAITSNRIVPAVLRASIEGLDADTIARRPDLSTWSIGEYLDHVRQVAHINRLLIEMALDSPGVDLGPVPGDDGGIEPTVKMIDVERGLSGIEREYHALRDLLSGLDDERWQHHVVLGGDRVAVDWFARHVIHDGLHHFADIGRIRHGFGLGAPTQVGTLTQINVSDGGVPKRAVASARIERSGVSGDSQADRLHHGRPVQAVCLWSADVIAELAADGHPIAAGNAGENLTIAGVDWATLRPGARIEVGDVPLLISAHAIPCTKNAQWFADRDFNRMLHDRNPGYSRLYAIPLGSGDVTVGTPVVVEPIE